MEGVSLYHRKQTNMDISKPGYHVAPVIIEVDYEVFKKSVGWEERLKELRDLEIFGPVFIAFKVKDIDEGAEVFNASSYRLTGGAITNSKAALAEIEDKFDLSGRWYHNRQITASYMGTAGFGPINSRSGTGIDSAGTPDCLNQFASQGVKVGFRPRNP